jgi:PAS domain S-box-containing protein
MTTPDPRFQNDPQFLRSVLDASRLLILVADRTGVIRHVNRAACRTADLSPDDCSRPIWDLPPLPVERDLLRSGFSPFRPDRFPSGVMFHLQGAGGTRLVDWDVGLLDPGDADLIVLTGVDVTERIAAQERLRETEAFQRHVLDRLPAIVWTTDRDLRTTFSAGGGLAQLGLASGEMALMGTPVSAYFQTDDPQHPGIASHLRALKGESCILEMNWFGRFFHSRIEPLRDQDGAITGTIGLSFDMTEQARTAEALRLSEAHLRRLVDANVMGIFFFDETGRVTQANQAFLELVGYSQHDLRSGAISWRAMTPPEFRALDDRAVAELKATGRCTTYEKAYVTKEGERVPVLVGGAAFDDDGHRDGAAETPLAGVAFIVDLREQVRLRETRDRLLRREQLARTETELANARLLQLVEGSKRLSRTMNPYDTLETLAAVVIPGLADWSYVVHRGWDGGSSLVAWATGDPNKRVLLEQLHDCMPDRDALEGAPRVFRTGEPALYEDIDPTQLMPDAPNGPIVGTHNPEYLAVLRALGMRSLLCIPIEGRSGVEGVIMLAASVDPHRYATEDIVLARDLAARAAVSLENGRLLSEALDAVRARDDFLAVAAHELRTPLTSLLLQIQILSRAIERDPSAVGTAAARSASAAQGQARRLSALVDGLLDVTRLASNRLWLRIEEMKLDELVDEVMTTMAPDFRRASCAVTVSVPPDVAVKWDRVRIEQVLTNLLSNAMKFGAGNPIEVSATAGDTHVEISVRDHGIGISKEDQQRIFGRFERAVPTRHFGGLGLGLYISAQIVRSHQGSFLVDSEPGKGSCFTVRLPRGTQPSPATTVESGTST